MPFWVGAGAVVLAVVVLAAGRSTLRHVDDDHAHAGSTGEAQVLTAADA